MSEGKYHSGDIRMGTTFDNCHIRASDSLAVMAAVQRVADGPCFVTTEPVNGWISVYADRDDHEKLARLLSAHLQTAALHFWIYASDVTGYELYENGERRDQFNSNPDLWVGEPDENGDKILPKSIEERAQLSGDPVTLLPFCLPGTTEADVQKELLADDDGADDIVWGLVKLFGFDAENDDGEEEQGAATYRSIAHGDVGFAVTLVNENEITLEQKGEALWDAVLNGSLPVIRGGSFRAVQRWLSLGADPNYRQDGVPVLVFAAAVAFPEAVEALLVAGADVNAQVNSNTRKAHLQGETALMATDEPAQWKPKADVERVIALLKAAGAKV